jgi:hypothetical protein
VSEQYNPNESRATDAVTPMGVVKVVVALFIGLSALVTVLAVLGVFAWFYLWTLLFKLAIVATILVVAILLISWLMHGKK